MRQALVNANADLAAANSKYVMRITGDNDEGKAQLDNFIDPESTYPGDRHDLAAHVARASTPRPASSSCSTAINSMTEFKQIIGRGTRINEDYNKFFFTIMDFKRATALFADPDFDGDPVQIYEPSADDPPVPPDDPAEAPRGRRRRPATIAVTLIGCRSDGSRAPHKYYVDDVEVSRRYRARPVSGRATAS